MPRTTTCMGVILRRGPDASTKQRGRRCRARRRRPLTGVQPFGSGLPVHVLAVVRDDVLVVGLHRVVAGLAVDLVVAALAVLDVVAGPAVQLVVAEAAVQVVVAAVAADVVVALVAVQVVVAVVARDLVV